MQHAVVHGLAGGPGRRLTLEQVAEIDFFLRRLRPGSFGSWRQMYTRVAADRGINPNVISELHRGKSWKSRPWTGLRDLNERVSTLDGAASRQRAGVQLT